MGEGINHPHLENVTLPPPAPKTNIIVIMEYPPFEDVFQYSLLKMGIVMLGFRGVKFYPFLNRP